ncbi:MAG: efflux RND transporter periplasmic adaptor subunit [Bacteroidota bacterium]
MKGTKIFTYQLMLVALTMAVTSCSKSGNDTKPTEGRGRQSIVVDGIVVGYSEYERTLTVPGTILPNEWVELRSEMAGKIVELNITEGSRVRKGQLLARINDADIRALLQRRVIEEKLAADDEQRKKRMLEINAISVQEYETSLNKLEAIRADIAQSKAMLEKAEVRAPFEGRIGLRYVSPGAFVSVNTTIATLVQDNPLKLEFAVPERYAGLVTNNMEVKFTTGDGQAQYPAKVYATDAQIDPETRSLKVRAIAENQNKALIPGSYVKATLVFEKSPRSILIPPRAIVPDMDIQNVFVYSQGKAKRVQVRLGERTGTTVEVIDGLSAGDSLIISGLTSIRNGMPVSLNIKQNQ